MARLWSSGAELQSATSGVEFETVTGMAMIDTTIKRSGAASLRCMPVIGLAGIGQRVYSTDQTAARVFLRTYLYIATAVAAPTGIMGWSDSAAATSGFFAIKLNASNQLFVSGSAGTTGTFSATLSTGTWYRVEMDYDDTANTCKGYLNGTLFATLTGADLGGGSFARFGVMNNIASGDIYLDDMAVNDSTGTVQNGLPGDGKIVHLAPNAQGDNNAFTAAVGGTAGVANNWSRVDGVPPNDSAGYNETTATGTTTTDDFNMVNATSNGIATGATINVVQVGIRGGSNAVTAASVVPRLKSQASGTVLEGASTSVAVSGWTTNGTVVPKNYKLTSYVDTQAGGAWTPALLDTAQIGYRSNVSQSTSRRVTTLWALVDYVPPTTQTHTASGSSDATGASSGSEYLTRTVAATDAAGVEASSGSVVASRTVSGASAGVAASSGSLSVTGAVSGTSTGVESSSGSAAATRVLTDLGSQGVGGSTGGATRATTTTGSSAGAGASSGSLLSTAVLAGTSAGLESSTGTLVPVRVVTGASAGVEASSGSVAVVLGVVGTSAGVGSSSGSMSASRVASGSSAGVGGATGATAANRTLGAGTSAGAGGSTGTSNVSGATASSSADGIGASSGAATLARTVAGASTGVGGSSAVEYLTLTASGSSAGLGGTAATATNTTAVSGSSAGLGATSGSVSTGSEMTGTSAGTSASTGSLSATRQFSGTSAGLGGTAGSDAKITTVSGTSAGAGSSTGLATGGSIIIGTSAGTGSSSGSQVAVHVTSGTSAGVGGTSGSVVASRVVEGTSAGNGASTGSLARTLTVSGASAGIAITSGTVDKAGQSQSTSGSSTGTGASTGALGVERNLTGTSAGVGGTTSNTLSRILGFIGTAAGIGGSSVSLTMVYNATATAVAYQTSTGILTVTSPLHATSDLVILNWLKTTVGLDPTKIAATLPDNVEEWGEIGFIQARTIGGQPDIDLPVQRPIVQIDVWATKPGTGRPLWNVANVLAMKILDATREERLMRRELVLPTGYPRARVLEAYPLTEPYRVESDPGSYARFRFDVQFHWVAVS